MVQRRAARYVKRNYRNTSSVGDMLNDLNWRTLEIRRKNQRLTMMYKIHNNLVRIDRDNFLERILPSHTHCYQYQIPVCTKDYHYYSFFPRATREWNKLSDAVHATTVEAFKAKLSAQLPTTEHRADEMSAHAIAAVSTSYRRHLITGLKSMRISHKH